MDQNQISKIICLVAGAGEGRKPTPEVGREPTPEVVLFQGTLCYSGVGCAIGCHACALFSHTSARKNHPALRAESRRETNQRGELTRGGQTVRPASHDAGPFGDPSLISGFGEVEFADQ